ncbi:MAG: putative methyltransferase [Myxococcaceae bacterium]|nr:putative methyltransferase [Myxococcaceae bacterium]
MRKLLVSFALLAACGGTKPAGGTTATPIVSPAVVTHTEAGDPIAAAVSAPGRTPENVLRDSARHPRETLRFFGIAPSQVVIELWPGRGWYTEILAPLLREHGKLVAVSPTGDYLQPYKDFLAAKPEAYDRVQLVEVAPPKDLDLGPDGSADAVLTFRNLHGWVQNGYAQQMHEAIFRVLKPGGVFGIEEHRARAGVSPDVSAKAGYISEEAAIAMATAAGLVLEERSEINANPKDTKDHPNGVWSLPPSLKGGETDKDKFVAIGESDRMTLRFRKPTAK